MKQPRSLTIDTFSGRFDTKETLNNKRFLKKYKHNADLFIQNNPSLYQTYYTNPLKIFHEGIADLHSYEEQNTKWNKDYSALNEETQDFLQSHLAIQKKKKQLAIKKNICTNPFNDLINQYRRKGYKIPDLSIKHNLFKQSVCLIQPNKIKSYYHYYKDLSKAADSGAMYIDKVDVYFKKYKAEENKPNKPKKPYKKYEKRTTLFRSHMLQKTKQETEKENQELAEYNKTIESFITTSLIDVEKIVPKNPKTTKNTRTNSTFFYSKSSNMENSSVNTSKFLKNQIQLQKFGMEKSHFNANNRNSIQIAYNSNLMSSIANDDSAIRKKIKLNNKKLSIDSPDLSIIERPSTKRIDSSISKDFERSSTKRIERPVKKGIERSSTRGIKRMSIRNIERLPTRGIEEMSIKDIEGANQNKRQETLISLRSQVKLDEKTKTLLRESEPNSYLKLIKNKIQYKVNQFDYESLKRIEAINPSNANNVKNKLKRLQKVVRHINKLDKELIQATMLI